MTEAERRKAIKNFVEYWQDKGYEKGESQPFWLSLLRDIFGIEKPEQYISFENKVVLDNTSFIDGTISATHVLIEQKSADKDLRKGIRQKDGSLLTPFQQAKRYSAEIPYSERPRWIVTCNFREFLIYDMEKPTGEPERIFLKDLHNEYYRLQFLVDKENEQIKKEMEISIQAGELVGVLYDEILKQYKDPESERALKSLNMLCVRLVFCLYAEDSGLFGSHLKFHDYLKSFEVKDVRRALIDLFKVLDTKPEDRDPYLDETLTSFPYVNGGLFADEDIEIPNFTDKIVNILLHNASENFNWSEISPTIFGAVFESTLNPETRRSGGMHYTSIENIHKVIDPLFLNDLREELDAIKQLKIEKVRKKRLEEYRKKLSELNFLDPACGSGNFLTETYLSLRKLDNAALREQLEKQDVYIFNALNSITSPKRSMQPIMGIAETIYVSIGQFYGIEINDFAVTVAKTALWIAESQMMKETEEIVNTNLDFLPLKSNANIIEKNALRIDWESVCPKEKLNYIMGNPPFVGAMMTDKDQKADMQAVIGDIKGLGELDYVSAWYYKATDYINGTKITCAFVSTNSICQGQQAVTLWKPLFEKGINIAFAHRTFRWDSEASMKAHVHCVVIGFSYVNSGKKILYDNDRATYVENINSYLSAGPNIFIESRSVPICDVPQMRFGSMPRGDFFYTTEEKDLLIKMEPLASKWIKRFIGADEFIKGKIRWCLWLVSANPSDLKKCPHILKKIEQVKLDREASKAAATRKFAQTPTLFCQIAQPNSDYLVVPCHSSETRKYIPTGFMSKEVICGNANMLVPDATPYHFGVLTSNVHMAWMRAVCGRIKSDYRYSKDIVYNNFPWPNPTAEQKAKIEQTAQAILDARALYPESSLADLYDELTMPVELRKAHQANDKAVMQAYGFDYKTMTESECVAELMKMYVELVKKC